MPCRGRGRRCALAQLFYGDDPDVPGRAAELVARTGAIHPAFLPAKGERLPVTVKSGRLT